jgi:hypothetical protein
LSVNPLPSAGTITGEDSTCLGIPITLSDTVASGTWSSNAPGGTLSPLVTGSITVTYTDTNSCGSITVSKTVIVHDSTILTAPEHFYIRIDHDSIITVMGTTVTLNATAVGTIEISDTVYDNCGRRKILVETVTVTDTTSTSLSVTQVSQHYRVYPNPATSEITVEAPDFVSMSILNVTGQVVLSSAEPKTCLDLAPGTYVLTVHTSSSVSNQLIQVNR